MTALVMGLPGGMEWVILKTVWQKQPCAAGDVQEAAGTLDHRKRQIEQAEERLGRVETLLADVQSNLELLHGQKAVVDQVSGTVASLELHAKRAEALIDTLREERDVTDQVREALAQLRQEEVVAKTA